VAHNDYVSIHKDTIDRFCSMHIAIAPSPTYIMFVCIVKHHLMCYVVLQVPQSELTRLHPLQLMLPRPKRN
jgi:hypothetical protein